MSGEYEVGLKMRRTVLGDDYVDQVMGETNEFTDDFQRLLTEYCWGSVWARPGLSLRDRSLLNIAMLVALNRPQELRLHVKGAIRNGCTKREIAEVLLQTAVYCGIPAAVTGYAVASETLGETETSGNGSKAANRRSRVKAPVLTKGATPQSLILQREIRHDGNRGPNRRAGHSGPSAVRRKHPVR